MTNFIGVYINYLNHLSVSNKAKAKCDMNFKTNNKTESKTSIKVKSEASISNIANFNLAILLLLITKVIFADF